MDIGTILQNNFRVGKNLLRSSNANVAYLFSLNLFEYIPQIFKNTKWSYHVCIEMFYSQP